MKRFLLLAMATAGANAQLTYPETRREKVTDTYHGETVEDPYRWLEDDNDAETKEWVKAQNKVTQQYLGGIAVRPAIRDRITELWNIERYGIPSYDDGYYLFSKNDGLQNQSPVYITRDLNAEAKVILDPNTLTDDGTAALKSYNVSPDGKLLAYGISRSGSDWQEWFVRDIASGKDTAEHLQWIKFSSVSWAEDSSGFYYSRYAAPKDGDELTASNENKVIYFHKIGTPQSEDTVVYKRPDHPKWGLNAYVTEDGNYLIIYVTRGTDSKNAIFYKDLRQGDSEVVELLPKFDAEYDFITNDGGKFIMFTDLNAPQGRVVSIDLTKPAPKDWKELIGEQTNTLRAVSRVGDKLIANYLKDARSLVQRYDLTGKLLGEIKLPGLGTASGFSGSAKRPETFFRFTSFTEPGAIYRYDSAADESQIFKKPQVKFDPAAFETKQVFVQSKDGTKVPAFIVHKKGIKLDGNNPTLLYGYGGFDISLTPRYGPTTIQWLEMGGIYVSANLRGGGEYGEKWHLAGSLLNKQNVFDDFIAIAEWLIDKNYTSSKKLAIRGGSNGGLLVGACMVQRPDLFGAALPAVGVLDMLRYHKFTIGWAWIPEYGSSEDKEMFPYLRGYSPYHNLEVGTAYPSTMVTTGDHDDRVVPAHSFKYAAALQHAHGGDAPVLIRIETDAGHGAGTPTSKRIDYAADIHAFLHKELVMDWQPQE